MTIIHLILVGFQPTVTEEEKLKVCQRVLGLKDSCVHPENNKPYIKSCIGGRDNSVAKLQRDITHAFVVEFENEADRNYYMAKDPHHLELVASIHGITTYIQLVDFTPGVFK